MVAPLSESSQRTERPLSSFMAGSSAESQVKHAPCMKHAPAPISVIIHV